MDTSANFPPSCESRATAVVAHRCSRAQDEVQARQSEDDDEEIAIAGVDAPSFASSVYSTGGSSCSSVMSSSSIVSDISVSPFTKRLIQNAMKATTATVASSATNKGTTTTRLLGPSSSSRKSSSSTQDTASVVESSSNRKRAKLPQEGEEDPEDRKICEAAAATLESTSSCPDIKKKAASVTSKTAETHTNSEIVAAQRLVDSYSSTVAANPSRPEDPVARRLLFGEEATTNAVEQQRQPPPNEREEGDEELILDVSKGFVASSSKAVGVDPSSNFAIKAKSNNRNSGGAEEDQSFCCQQKLLEQNEEQKQSSVQQLQQEKESEEKRPSKMRRTTDQSGPNASAGGTAQPADRTSSSSTTTTRRFVRRRDYGYIIPNDFLPIQYSKTAMLAAANASSSSSHSYVSSPSSFAAAIASKCDSSSLAKTMQETCVPSVVVPNPLLGIPSTPPTRSSTITSSRTVACDRGRRENIIDTVLSDDVLSRCLYTQGYLNSYETARLIRVSKKWRRLARQTVWKLDLSNTASSSSNTRSSNNKLQIKKKKRSLSPTSDDNNGSNDDDDGGYGILNLTQMKRLVCCFNHLTTLDLSYCKDWGKNDELSCLIPLSKTLTHLSLKGTAVCDKQITQYLKDSWTYLDFAPSLPLESLDLSAITKHPGSLQIGDETVMSIVKHCPKIRCLRLAWCRRVTDHSIACMAGTSEQLPFSGAAGLRYLEELDLSLTGLTDACAMNLGIVLANNGKSLRCLDLSATFLTNDGMHQVICQATSQLMKLQDGRTSPSVSSWSRCPSPALSTTSAINSRCQSPETVTSAATSFGSCCFDALQHLTLRFIDGLNLDTVQKWLGLATSSPSCQFRFLDITYSGEDNAAKLVATTEDNPELILLLQQYQERLLSTQEGRRNFFFKKKSGLTLKGLVCKNTTHPPPSINKRRVTPSRNETKNATTPANKRKHPGDDPPPPTYH